MKQRIKTFVTLSCLVMAATCLAAEQPRPAAGAALLTAVSIQPDTSGKTFVDLATTRPTAYHVFRLDRPARLVVDLEHTALGTSGRDFQGRNSLVKDVRIGQFHNADPAVVRVVADVTGTPIFDVQTQPHGLRLVIESRDAAGQHSTPRTETAAQAQPVPSEAVESRPRSPRAVPVVSMPQVSTAPAAVPTALARLDLDRNTPPVPAPRSSGPVMPRVDAQAAVKEPSPARVSPPPAVPVPARDTSNSPDMPDANVAPKMAAMTPPEPPREALQAAQAAEIVSQTSQNSSSAPIVTKPGVPTASVAAAPTQYTGERISLNLKDVDLKDFFRLIHEISGLNVIIDPNVTGTVTLVLDDVPWDQALDIVLKNNGLGKVLEGNVLRIAKIQTLTAEQEDAARLKEAVIDSEPLVTVFRSLNYARVTAVPVAAGGATTGGGVGAIAANTDVMTIVKNFLSKRGSVVADPRNNALVITDVQSQIPIIDAVLSKLDRKTKQVSIEAKIVLTTDDFTRQLQTALNAGALNKSGVTVVGGATGSGASATPNIQLTNPPPTSRITIGQTSATGFGAFALSNLGARYFVGAAISAAEARNQAKVISAPTIVTQNNVKGEVVQGSQIPLQTTINNTVTTIYINAALTLDVTPQVTEDGHVFLIIQVTNNSPGPVLTGSQNPEINTQSATTQVLVDDGGTVVFGGVKLTNHTKSKTQIPGIGNIPLLGDLFKSTNREDQENDLIFVITPKILPG